MFIMLVQATGKCDRCGIDFENINTGLIFTMQEVHLYCPKCKKYYNLCRNCRKLGCPSCGSRLLDMLEYEKEINGRDVLF